MLRGGSHTKKNHWNVFPRGGIRICAGGGPNLRRGGSAFAEGGVRIWSRGGEQDKVYFFRNKSRLN